MTTKTNASKTLTSPSTNMKPAMANVLKRSKRSRQGPKLRLKSHNVRPRLYAMFFFLLIFFYSWFILFLVTPTIRKCVTQKEMSSLQVLGINTNNGCHDIRTAKRRHKLYCFCENDLCNTAARFRPMNVFPFVCLGFFLALGLTAV